MARVSARARRNLIAQNHPLTPKGPTQTFLSAHGTLSSRARIVLRPPAPVRALVGGSRGRSRRSAAGGAGNCPNILIGVSCVHAHMSVGCLFRRAHSGPRPPGPGQTSVPEPVIAMNRRLPHQPVLRDVSVLPTPPTSTTGAVAGVLGGRRVRRSPAPHPGSPGSSGSAAISPFAPGTLTITSTASVYVNAVYIFAYGNYGNPALGNTLGNLAFPGTHGLAIDFPLPLRPYHRGDESRPLHRLLILHRPRVGATWHGTITPPSGGGPFRFRTTWISTPSSRASRSPT